MARATTIRRNLPAAEAAAQCRKDPTATSAATQAAISAAAAV